MAAVFIAPDAQGERAVLVPGPEQTTLTWLSPLAPGQVTLAGEPPRTLEHAGLRFERTRRLPVRVRRLGTGAPELGATAVIGEYAAPGRERLVVVVGSDAAFAWRGVTLTEGEYEVLPGGAATLRSVGSDRSHLDEHRFERELRRGVRVELAHRGEREGMPRRGDSGGAVTRRRRRTGLGSERRREGLELRNRGFLAHLLRLLGQLECGPEIARGERRHRAGDEVVASRTRLRIAQQERRGSCFLQTGGRSPRRSRRPAR